MAKEENAVFVGRRPTMNYVMATMMILVPLIPRLPLLAVVWLILGVGSGALDVGGNTLLIWVHGRQVGPYMNGLHFFFGQSCNTH